jgi:hypothetical protein
VLYAFLRSSHFGRTIAIRQDLYLCEGKHAKSSLTVVEVGLAVLPVIEKCSGSIETASNATSTSQIQILSTINNTKKTTKMMNTSISSSHILLAFAIFGSFLVREAHGRRVRHPAAAAAGAATSNLRRSARSTKKGKEQQEYDYYVGPRTPVFRHRRSNENEEEMDDWDFLSGII